MKQKATRLESSRLVRISSKAIKVAELNKKKTDVPIGRFIENIIFNFKEVEELKIKAKKWDELENRVSSCYGKEDANGNWEEFDEEDNEDMGNDLIKIGEMAAHAFGFM